MKSILQYPGSKWRIAKQIVSLLPPHHTYLEPYFGSGAVLFNKSRSDIETINDLDENVVNFFQWLKNDPEKLAHELWYIPYSHSVYCIMLNMGHGFRTGGPVSGWKSDIHGRERAYAAKNWASLPSRLEEAAARLRGVQIECMPALELIPKYRYKDVLLYLDPPYVLSSRAGGLQYAKER
jgi:DNA adenine methylase